LDRAAAARFSFLLSVPVIVLSGLYKLKDLAKPHTAEPGMMAFGRGDMLIATVVAGIVGYASIAFLMRYLRTHSTLVFVIYRVIVGALLLYLIATNHLAPL
jgi:undecaprenyl-diphosphatase